MRLIKYGRATHIVAPTTGIVQYHSPTKTYHSPVTAKILPLTVLGILDLCITGRKESKPRITIE